MEKLPEVYPLTGLQIGDIQSYVSRAFLHFAPSSSRLLILVDNRPWLMHKLSRSARLWQLMVTKYRISPFMNTRKLHKTLNTRTKAEMNGCYDPNHGKTKRLYRWLPNIDSAKWQEKYLLSLMDLSKALHGFIIFEVAWKDVHGINYLNELQTDTSVALEVKLMKKWEFNSPDQASICISSWFSGRLSEIQSLKNSLRKLSDLDTHHWAARSSPKKMFLHKRLPSDVLSDDDFLDVQESLLGIEDEINFISPSSDEVDDDSTIASTHYYDTLILFRFSDNILPFKLKQIIMSDLRLLTLLEAGLPSWVIFFQSYPLFCHFYRPWMRHLARTLYILISLVTVIIGFYDLYKNVPLLKATAARLCGPLFSWIEECDMVSRIRYLGTMLFLQNLEKGFKWFRIMVRSTRALLVTIAKPLCGPLSNVVEFISPLWNACSEVREMITSTACFISEFMYSSFLDLIEALFWPFELLYSCISSIAVSVHILLGSVWDLVLVPARCLLALASYLASLLSATFDLLKDVWESASGFFQLAALSGPKQGRYEISVWRGLWNDLFSQVFRATRSIINGLVAFFMTCNRHRLSIYNHMLAFLEPFARFINLAPRTCYSGRMPQMVHHHEDDAPECDYCK